MRAYLTTGVERAWAVAEYRTSRRGAAGGRPRTKKAGLFSLTLANSVPSDQTWRGEKGSVEVIETRTPLEQERIIY